MPDGTLQILGSGTSAVPLDVPISGNQLLDLIAVKADFDGSAAGVDFVPMIEILSDAGVVMAQAKGSTVTAGDSATVTFFPFGADESADSGGGITEIDSPDGSIVVTNPTGPVVDVQRFKPLSEGITGLFNAPAGTAGLLTLTHAGGSLLLDYTDPQNPTIKTPGYYAAFMIGTGGGAYAAGVQFEMALSFINSPDPLAIGGDATTVGDGASQCLISLNTATALMNTLSALNVFGFNHDAAPQPIGCSVVVQKIWPA